MSQPSPARRVQTDCSLSVSRINVMLSIYLFSVRQPYPCPLPRKNQASRKNYVHSNVPLSLSPPFTLQLPPPGSMSHGDPSATSSCPHCSCRLHFVSLCCLTMCIDCCHQMHGKSIFRKGGISGVQFKAGYSLSWWKRMAEGQKLLVTPCLQSAKRDRREVD